MYIKQTFNRIYIQYNITYHIQCRLPKIVSYNILIIQSFNTFSDLYIYN